MQQIENQIIGIEGLEQRFGATPNAVDGYWGHLRNLVNLEKENLEKLKSQFNSFKSKEWLEGIKKAILKEWLIKPRDIRCGYSILTEDGCISNGEINNLKNQIYVC